MKEVSKLHYTYFKKNEGVQTQNWVPNKQCTRESDVINTKYFYDLKKRKQYFLKFARVKTAS